MAVNYRFEHQSPDELLDGRDDRTERNYFLIQLHPGVS